MGTVYVCVYNIPLNFRSKHLRSYFSAFVESAFFDCFHFKHRPAAVLLRSQPHSISDGGSTSVNPKTFCCFVRLDSEQKRDKLIKDFHGKLWTDLSGNSLSSRCFICSVKIASTDQRTSDQPEPLSANKAGMTISDRELNSLSELKPPSLMPLGNVGTPTSFFLGKIQECKLPSKVIKQLSLSFPKSHSSRIYSAVPPIPSERVFSTAHQSCSSSSSTNIDHFEASDPTPDDDQPAEDEEAEEWDRHEALYDDVTAQDRNKERLFEEDVEVTWDKGSSGLVFYTDAAFWKQIDEPDFEEETVDDWDVDMTAYEEGSVLNADKDARDYYEFRRQNMLASGKLVESVFAKRKRVPVRQHLRNRSPPDDRAESAGGSHQFGHFERYTRGIGKKLLEASGWKPGEGLGRTIVGKPLPVSDEGAGQPPSDKRGFGYYGDKFDQSSQRKKAKHLITTVYDDKPETDPPATLLCRSELTRNVYRS